MDEYQKIVYKKFPAHSWLSNKNNFERIIDYVTFIAVIFQYLSSII